jgi:hypothetical protein
MRAPCIAQAPNRALRLALAIQLVVTLALALVACGGTQLPPIVVKSMPEGGSFTGVWFSPEYGEMHMRQSGASAIGRYSKDERSGRIQGHVEGDVMRFEWTEKRELLAGRSVQTKGHGYFRITKDDADKTWKLAGEWGNDAAERGGGPWTAVKSRTMKPRVDEKGNETETTDDDSSGSSSSGGEDDSSSDGFEGKDVNRDLDGL